MDKVALVIAIINFMYEKYKQKTKLLDFSSLEIIIKNTRAYFVPLEINSYSVPVLQCSFFGMRMVNYGDVLVVLGFHNCYLHF